MPGSCAERSRRVSHILKRWRPDHMVDTGPFLPDEIISDTLTTVMALLWRQLLDGADGHEHQLSRGETVTRDCDRFKY